jgi:hypothetical protein
MHESAIRDPPRSTRFSSGSIGFEWQVFTVPAGSIQTKAVVNWWKTAFVESSDFDKVVRIG